MKLFLHRTYYADGTNGILNLNEEAYPFCYTIELPWKGNQRNISCIPPGTYKLRKRFSKKFKWHLYVQDVPGRSLILLHPANDAQRELQGCIAPVTTLTGVGKGNFSQQAFQKLVQKVYEAIRANETILLIIDPAVKAGSVINLENEKDHQQGGGANPAILQKAA